MATFFAEEIVEAIRYLEDPNFYVSGEEVIDKAPPISGWARPTTSSSERRGVEFVDGTAPGLPPSSERRPTPGSRKMVLELQEKNLYVFMCGENRGQHFSRAARRGRRPDRLAHAPRPLRPGHLRRRLRPGFRLPRGHGLRRRQARRLQLKILIYNKDRIFAFVIALGDVTDEWYANAPGPSTGASRPSPTRTSPRCCPPVSAPTSTWSPTPHAKSCAKGHRSAGPQGHGAEGARPGAYGPAFEGERVRRTTSTLSAAAARPMAVEWSPASAWKRWKTARSR